MRGFISFLLLSAWCLADDSSSLSALPSKEEGARHYYRAREDLRDGAVGKVLDISVAIEAGRADAAADDDSLRQSRFETLGGGGGAADFSDEEPRRRRRRRLLLERQLASEGEEVDDDNGVVLAGVDERGYSSIDAARDRPESDADGDAASSLVDVPAKNYAAAAAHGDVAAAAVATAADDVSAIDPPEVSGEMKKLDDALNSLHKRLEEDLHRVEEDAAAQKQAQRENSAQQTAGERGDAKAAPRGLKRAKSVEETSDAAAAQPKQKGDILRKATLKHYQSTYKEKKRKGAAAAAAPEKEVASVARSDKGQMAKPAPKKAGGGTNPDAASPSGSIGITDRKNSSTAVLTQDITAVRRDVTQLLRTVTEAERELRREKVHIEEEQHEIDRRAAEIEAEKIVAGMKEGTVKVHVDYESGKVVVDRDDIRRSAARAAERRSSARRSSAELVGAVSEDQPEEAGAVGKKGGAMTGGDAAAPGAAAAEKSLITIAEDSSAEGPSAKKLDHAAPEVGGKKKRPDEDASSVDVIIDAAKDAVQKRESASTSADSVQKAIADDGQDDNAPDAAPSDAKKKPNEIELDPALRSRVEEEIEALRTEEDPAVMNLDVQLLLDVVTVAIAAAVFGMLAAFLRLPPTAGFLLGGMCIGPSALDWVMELRQVQTLAQFGSIFLLFEQGLLYSQTYKQVSFSSLSAGMRAPAAAAVEDVNGNGKDESRRDADGSLPSRTRSGHHGSHNLLRRSGSGTDIAFEDGTGTRMVLSALTPRTSSLDGSTENGDNPNVVGAIVLIVLVFSLLTIFIFFDVSSSVSEAIIISSSVALCSTTIVSENLHMARIEHSDFGRSVLKMISMQDLFMVVLLALPDTCRSFNEQILGVSGDNSKDEDDNESVLLGRLAIHVVFIAAFVKLSLLLARHVVHATILAESRVVGGKGGELFTLSTVAYVLMMSAMAEELSLSIEAGAVFAGIVLIRSTHVPKLLESIQPLSSVFGGMYLTSMGMIMSPTFVLNQAGAIIWLVCAIGAFKLILISYLLYRLFHYGATASLAVGSAMAQVSEISLLVMAKAQRLGLMSRQVYLMLIPTTCILLTLAPFSASHLRQLKMKEISGSEDDGSSFSFHVARYFSGLTRPGRASSSFQTQNGNQILTYELHSHRV